MTATLNGTPSANVTARSPAAPPRKQLSGQLDRLDRMLDVLGDGLSEAVADAVRDGARLAVKDAVLEVLASPDLRALLARPPADVPVSGVMKPGVWAGLKAKLSAALGAVRAKLSELRVRAGDSLRPLAAKAAEAGRAATPVLSAAARLLSLAWGHRTAILVAVGIGLAVWAACALAPHPVAAVVSGVGGCCTTLGVQGGLWVRAAARKLGLL